MRITKARIVNYKRFRDSGTVAFAPGINVIVGQNDAGKTAIVEALSLRAQGVPHRSLLSLPEAGMMLDPESASYLTVWLSSADIRRALAPHKETTVNVEGGQDDLAFSEFVSRVENGGDCDVVWSPSVRGLLGSFAGMVVESERKIIVANDASPSQFSPRLNGAVHQGGPGNYGAILAGYIQRSIYVFQAERLKLAQAAMGPTQDLRPDAGNLAQVLNQLQTSNPSRFRRLVRHVVTVFPHLREITVRPIDNSQVLIEVWDIDPELERSDLAISLAESGTGIGQVLAILYVVVTSDLPRIIIIDEPHSFLHPGAVRKLFGILRGYTDHQYVVTTHSPAAILSATPASLSMARRDGYESKISPIDQSSGQDLLAFLDEVGARVSDVFGPDRILWVEGKTEEHVFPLLLRTYAPDVTIGLDVLAVQQTGDFDGKHAERLFAIYRRLTSGASILPPAVGFVLDGESRTLRQRGELQRQSGGLLHFLPRRMLENYFILPPLLARVLAERDPTQAAEHTEARVREWLSANGASEAFFRRGGEVANWDSPEWLLTVDGAKVLTTMFSALSQSRVSYDKVRDGMAITKAAIETREPGLHGLVTEYLLPVVFGQRP